MNSVALSNLLPKNKIDVILRHFSKLEITNVTKKNARAKGDDSHSLIASVK